MCSVGDVTGFDHPTGERKPSRRYYVAGGSSGRKYAAGDTSAGKMRTRQEDYKEESIYKETYKEQHRGEFAISFFTVS